MGNSRNAKDNLNDKPIASSNGEKLGLKVYARNLGKFILNECDTPCMIAVQGDWGIGKTSFMNLVKEIAENPNDEFGNGKQNICVYYNTWQYSQFGESGNLPVSFLTIF